MKPAVLYLVLLHPFPSSLNFMFKTGDFMKVMNFKNIDYSDSNIWLNFDEILSKNRAINFIIGPRGRGKTYGELKWHIKRFIKMYYKRKQNPKWKKPPIIEEQIYMRRYQTELDICANSLYNKVSNEFPDYEFKYESYKWYIRPKQKEEKKTKGRKKKTEEKWMVLCHLLAVSTAYKLKGTSFPNVKYLCYDEFLFEKGQVNKELKEEVNKFLNVLETVFRMRNDFRVFMLGNATTFESSYKYEFNLQLPFNSNFWYSKEKPMLVCLANNKAFLEAKQESLVGILARGTTYEQGMIFNEFYGDSTTFIRKKVGNYRRLATFNYKENYYAIYYKTKLKKYEIIIDTYKYDGKLTAFTIKSDDMNPAVANMIFNRNNPIYDLLRKYFNKNCLFYQNMRVKTGLHNVFMKIF